MQIQAETKSVTQSENNYYGRRSEFSLNLKS